MQEPETEVCATILHELNTCLRVCHIKTVSLLLSKLAMFKMRTLFSLIVLLVSSFRLVVIFSTKLRFVAS